MHISTQVDITIEDLSGQITSKRFTPAYKRTTYQFILEWPEFLNIIRD